MKINNHISKLYLYIPIMESDGLKLIDLFEDYDETSINYNLNSKKKELKFFFDTDLEDIKTNNNNVKIKNKKNFFNDFFYKK